MNLKYEIIKKINYLLYFEIEEYNIMSACLYGDMQDIIVFLEKILYTQGQDRFDIISNWVKKTNYQTAPLIYDDVLEIGMELGVIVVLMPQYDYHNDSTIYFRPEDNSIIILPHRFLYYDFSTSMDRLNPNKKPLIIPAGLLLEFLKWWCPYLKSLEADNIVEPITGSFYWDETKAYPPPKFDAILLDTAKKIIARETEVIKVKGENWESLQQIKAWSQIIKKEERKQNALPTRITALQTLTKSRPLLAREQLEMECLQSILAARDIAEIDALLAKISNTPTDAELRKRLLTQAEAKRELILDNNV